MLIVCARIFSGNVSAYVSYIIENVSAYVSYISGNASAYVSYIIYEKKTSMEPVLFLALPI